MAAEQHRDGSAPREIQEFGGEHSARWREIDREMQETDRRQRKTYELFVSEWGHADRSTRHARSDSATE